MSSSTLRILVVGATGAMGKALVPRLAARGHVVGGAARDPASVAARGGLPIELNLLDRDAVNAAVAEFRPEVIIHQATALPEPGSLWRFDRAFAQTNRLRRDGLDNLIAAATTIGTRRLIVQSFCGWNYARVGGPVKSESDPLDPDPPAALSTTLETLRYAERRTLETPGLDGVALRYGGFYGRHTHLAPGSRLADRIRRGRVPLIGDGEGMWSFIHIDDAAEATVLAAEASPTGLFNVVDDEPAPMGVWLPALAEILNGPEPPRVPAWLARIVLPAPLRIMASEARGGSNVKFKDAFDWRPRLSSWRGGFAELFACTA